MVRVGLANHFLRWGEKVWQRRKRESTADKGVGDVWKSGDEACSATSALKCVAPLLLHLLYMDNTSLHRTYYKVQEHWDCVRYCFDSDLIDPIVQRTS